MFVFKTSGATFDSVITNQKHAFNSKPLEWDPGEIILVSKNKNDCQQFEKQIQYSMRLVNIRSTSFQEIEKFWPGNGSRWRYIVDCSSTKLIPVPFNLEDILGDEAQVYKSIMTFRKVDPEDEKLILPLLNRV